MNFTVILIKGNCNFFEMSQVNLTCEILCTLYFNIDILEAIQCDNKYTEIPFSLQIL